jgi:hypothetical protein
MIQKGVKNMADVMDRLIAECKENPNLMITSEPSVLKRDLKYSECPYCKKENPKELLGHYFDQDTIKVYISNGSLWVNSDDYYIFEFKDINYCPICGRHL